MFKKYDKFWKKEYEELARYCETAGIEFLSTPFDVESATFLNDIMPVFKISSSDITNLPFIEYQCRFGKPIILSTDTAYKWEVMQALEKARPVRGGIPLLFERQRDNVQLVKEKIADYVDPPRFIPLIGMASLHHAHYKCTVYFTERTINGWPVPYTLEDPEAVEVLYIDHNHFHMCGNPDTGASSIY